MPKENASFVTASKYLCLPAVIETLLRLREYQIISQFEIANEIGIVLPDHCRPIELHNYSHSSSSMLWGLKPDPLTITNLLAKKSIPLICTYHHYSEFEDWSFEEAIQKAAAQEEDVIFCFDYRLLSRDLPGRLGHAALLLDYKGTGFRGFFSIFDPGPEKSGIKQVSAEDMFLNLKSINGGWLHFFPSP